jgi:nicotianamine synthase
LDLSRLELNALLSITPNPPSAIAFLGSGPLPLTSICLATLLHPTTPGLRILNIDHDPAAIKVSARLCATLPGPQSAVQEFKCASATDAATDLATFDVVYVAALVGMSAAEKEEVVRSVVRKMKRGALVVLRSAHSLRGLLYPVVDVAGLERVGLKVEVVVHPWNRVVNSVIVARVVS